jgi:hypothetical protein
MGDPAMKKHTTATCWMTVIAMALLGATPMNATADPADRAVAATVVFTGETSGPAGVHIVRDDGDAAEAVWMSSGATETITEAMMDLLRDGKRLDAFPDPESAAAAVKLLAEGMAKQRHEIEMLRLQQVPPAAALGTSAEDRSPTPYLGVSATPLKAEIGRTTGLSEGVGLQVVSVDPGSPAAGAIQRDDILHRLDDQLLCHPDQLAALIRMRQAGDKVALSVIRAGEPVTAEVELSSRELPSLQSQRRARTVYMTYTNPSSGAVVSRSIHLPPASRSRTVRTFHGDNHTVMITIDDEGKNTARIADLEGTEIFSGPADSEDDLKAVPAEHLPVVRRLLQMRSDGTPQDRAAPPLPAVTLRAHALPIGEVLDLLSRISGVPVDIRGGPLPETPITVEFTDTPFRDALKFVADAAKLSYAMTDGRVVITVGVPQP